MKNFFVTFLLCMNYCCFSCEPPSSEKIIRYSQNNLPHFGILKNTNGFVYVDVDDEYVHELIQFIEKSGFQKPPYFGSTDLVGAHITVIYPNEMEQYNLEQIEETGLTIFFQPVGCELVAPPNWKEIDQVYVLIVDSLQLDQIRKKYGLPNREYKFHITIGVKPNTIEVISK